MADKKLLEGKVAIISGSGRGIGAGTARVLAKYGASVVVVDPGVNTDGTGHDGGPADNTVAEIKKAGGKAVANYDSVTTFEGTTKMVKTALDTFGRLDIVISNAGILRDRMFHKMSPEDWHAVIDVHMNGAYNLSRAAINIFREQNFGRVICLSSTSGVIGGWGQTNYGAAKLGLVAFTRNLSLESVAKGVTVNAICPSANTRMNESVPLKTEDPAAVEARRIKMERSKPEYIGLLAAYLCSEWANDVSGQTFHVNAGEISIFSLHRPVRTVHHANGWTPQLIGEIAMPRLMTRATPYRRTRDVFPTDPLE
jgi:NAD(P)-dependent dehydrogenase (short-subunit alcohol dehydrogenase family)